MSNPYLKRRETHTIGKSGRASEKRLIRQLQAKGRPASGALEGSKGDIDLGTVLMEAKSTTSRSMGIKLEWLAKISREARQEGKSPALMVSFVNPEGNPVIDGEWVMVPRHAWEANIK